MYSATKLIFVEKWAKFQAKYETKYQVTIDYFQNNLIVTWKQKLIKYYINKLCHFRNTTTSQVERNYAKIKRQLNNILNAMID